MKRVLVSIVIAFGLLVSPELSAQSAEINLSHPSKNTSLEISIGQSQSDAYSWKQGQKIRVTAFVERLDGRKERIQDAAGADSWEVILDSKGEGRISFVPSRECFSGHLTVMGNGKRLNDLFLEKVHEYRFADGAGIKIHFTDQILERSGADIYFGREVLHAAVLAYQTLTQFEGFTTPGYSFASPDKRYAYDPDKTMDIYLGLPSDRTFDNSGLSRLSFKDAPCFDTIKLSGSQYQAVILLPANYKEFIKSWEKTSPSPLGPRNVNVDLRGTLIHEMLHVVLFYYNKNLNEDTVRQKKMDWYVEGLARYFETFVGARHDFFSQGFKQTLADKIRFSRGGSNYFMRYPDQAFVDLRYENALFWRFIDNRYGMKAIERLSRDFRECPAENAQSAIEKMTQRPFNELLKQFAVSILLKDFGLKEDTVFLKDVAKTHLVYKHGGFYLKDGYGSEKWLGSSCHTDWVGEWDKERSGSGGAPVAGDNTAQSDVSGWATDFYQVDLDPLNPSLPWLGIRHESGGMPLLGQIVMVTKGGSVLIREMRGIATGDLRGLNLKEAALKEGLMASDIEKIYILVTNTDPKTISQYALVSHP